MAAYPEWLPILSLAFLSFSFLFAGIIIITNEAEGRTQDPFRALAQVDSPVVFEPDHDARELGFQSLVQ